jgi:hypothetical protein
MFIASCIDDMKKVGCFFCILVFATNSLLHAMCQFPANASKGNLFADASELLVKDLIGEDPSRRDAAKSQLINGRMLPPPLIEAALISSNQQDRRRAMEVVSHLRGADAATVCIASLYDSSPDVVYNGMLGIVQNKGFAALGVFPLLKLCDSEMIRKEMISAHTTRPRPIACDALWALGNTATESPVVINRLLNLAKDSPPLPNNLSQTDKARVRIEAIVALINLGHNDAAGDLLLSILIDSEDIIQEFALYSLFDILDAKIQHQFLDEVSAMLESNLAPSVRRVALSVIEALEPDRKPTR